MKKLYSWGVAAILLSLCIVACNKTQLIGKTKPFHVPYAIDRYHIPTKCSLRALTNEQKEPELRWEFLLGNEGGSESYISLPKNKKEFTEVALEHGEDGSGFMTCIPLPMSAKLIYKMKKIQVFGVKGNDETELTSQIEITYDSIEGFIRSGYKNLSGPFFKKERKSLAALTANDYLWIPMESILSCNGSEIKGKFDRVEVRVTLKDGKTLRTDMPL
ncbi:MAG: hypothetical protein ACFNJO_02365 [Porphyromonas endodontalis]